VRRGYEVYRVEDDGPTRVIWARRGDDEVVRVFATREGERVQIRGIRETRDRGRHKGWARQGRAEEVVGDIDGRLRERAHQPRGRPAGTIGPDRRFREDPIGYEPLPDRRTPEDRRRLDDRRSGVDRRSRSERRQGNTPVPNERRSRSERRSRGERRRAPRRSLTPRRLVPDRRARGSLLLA